MSSGPVSIKLRTYSAWPTTPYSGSPCQGRSATAQASPQMKVAFEFGIVNSDMQQRRAFPPPSNEEFFSMTLFGFLMVGLCFLGKNSKYRRV